MSAAASDTFTAHPRDGTTNATAPAEYLFLVIEGARPGAGGATDRVRLTLFDSQDAVIFQGELPETHINFLGYIADAPTIARGQAVGISPSNGFIFVDNFSYLVPEPATMSLLALGALAMLKRRRK